jgi:hypothetical protein
LVFKNGFDVAEAASAVTPAAVVSTEILPSVLGVAANLFPPKRLMT